MGVHVYHYPIYQKLWMFVELKSVLIFFSDNKERLLCDSLQSKSILENAVINNSE